MNSKWQFLHAFWEHRTKLLVLVLILSLIASQPIKAQFGIDWAPVVTAINRIGAAISTTIAPALIAIEWALGTLNRLMTSIHVLFTNDVYPRLRSIVHTAWSLQFKVFTHKFRRFRA